METQLLTQIHTWMKKHDEMLIGSLGLPHRYFDGYSLLSENNQTLYLFIDGKPNGPLAVKGMKN